MRRTNTVRVGALAGLVLAAAVTIEGAVGDGVRAGGSCAASPTPAASPGARAADDPVSGAPEVGVGHSTGAVKSSGDEGGTAAGMPGKGAESGR